MSDGPEDERELDAQRMAAPEVEPVEDDDEPAEYDDDARDYHESRRYDRWRDDGF